MCLLQPDGSYKPWHGNVLGAAQLGADAAWPAIRCTCTPGWPAGQVARQLVFQDKTALAIAEDVFRNYPLAP